MSLVVVTGSAGLVGSEAARFFCERGWDVVGIDNDMCSRFFGPEASTEPNRAQLEAELKGYHHGFVSVRGKLQRGVAPITGSCITTMNYRISVMNEGKSVVSLQLRRA
jgi:NAD(P)-dependent dehydrogenase (short-subunit alcohol dehydrogenase family)